MNHQPDITVRIETLAYGRAAIGRVDGKVVFVESACPGDLVLARVSRDRGSYFEATVAEVLEAGPARVEPPCPLVDRCGGCGWQHVAYDAQLAAKHRSVIDALERIAGVENPPVEPVVPSPRELGYRNRLKLRFEGGRIGFYRAHTHRLVPIDDCLIAEPRVRDALPEVQRFVARLATQVTRVEIASRGELDGVVVAVNSSGRLRRADAEHVRAVLSAAATPIAGVTMWGRGWRRQWGDCRRRFAVAPGTTLESSGASFGQVNTEGNRALVESVCATVARASHGRILDLYAGAGNFSLPLARGGARVDAVEQDATAVAAGRASAKHHRLGSLRFHHARVEDYVAKRSPTGARPDCVVVNPPRNGLAGAAAAIAAMASPSLVYVSCNPATLARDLERFLDRGYRLERITPFDLFPHSHHVEVVCHARLT